MIVCFSMLNHYLSVMVAMFLGRFDAQINDIYFFETHICTKIACKVTLFF